MEDGSNRDRRGKITDEVHELKQELQKVLEKIKKPEEEAYLKAKEHNDNLCKPLGSLGKLEEIYLRLAGIFPKGFVPFKKAVVVFAGDNGVVAEKVSANPVDTTYKVCLNILNGRSGLAKIASFYQVDVFLEDIGVIQDVVGHTDHKVLYGTGNIAKEPAMTIAQAMKTLLAGIGVAEKLYLSGYNLMAAGEMGTGNTTTAAALIAALTGLTARETTGLGSGLDGAGLERKISAVQTALNRIQGERDPLELLRNLGGADIGAMAGFYLGCAAQGIPFVLDGVISMAAMLLAKSLHPGVMDYAFASHLSSEPGANLAAKSLALEPPLMMNMRLGEGSGAPFAMNLMECAVYTLTDMASFSDVSVKKEDYIDIRENLDHEK